MIQLELTDAEADLVSDALVAYQPAGGGPALAAVQRRVLGDVHERIRVLRGRAQMIGRILATVPVGLRRPS